MAEMKGGCMCGRIRFTVGIDDDKAYLCHCRMCQRATGGVSVAYKNVKAADVRWDREPDYYRSSPIAERGFCSQCGTTLSFRFADGESENMDLTVGAYDDPSRFRPVHHIGVESLHRAWINTEGLPEYRTEDYKPLADRWIKTVGKLPD